ncbi:hypothetical protein [Mycobacterium sp. URHB0021]
MPKKMTDGLPMFGDAGRFVALPTWLAAGMSLAAAGVAATRGPGALAAAAVLAPMVWAFGRLHRHAPSADTTSDLVAQVLGMRAGIFVGLLQLVGCLLLGAGFAEGVGLAVPLWFTRDVDAVHAGSWWPACSVAAVILAAALTYFCRTWIVVCIAAVVGVAGVLVYFYIALAIAARAAAGSVSQSVDAAMTSQPPLATAALLTTLGLALLGIEAVTTLSDRVSSTSRG